MEVISNNNLDIGLMKIDADKSTAAPDIDVMSVRQQISFSVKFGNQVYSIVMDASATLQSLRDELHRLTGILPACQKITYKGIMKDDALTLKELKVVNGAKLMMLGSKIEDVMATTVLAEKVIDPVKSDLKEDTIEINPNEDKEHMKHLEERPSDSSGALPGINEPVPPMGIKGLRNKMGTSIRLSLKGNDVLLSSNSSTTKVPFGAISEVKTWPIKGHDNYNIVCLVCGKNKYWIYWVPCQYIRNLKIAILGWGNV